jgi:pantoate--beta-alanine ligase
MKHKPITIKTIAEMRAFVNSLDKSEVIGFVPTMGYLHEGHLSLVTESTNNATKTIVSIFVNPTQFSANEDFDKYPRDINRDIQYISEYKVDVVFIPDHKEMYPEGFKTYVEVDELSNKYCGRTRIGHFHGVATIVNKLVNIIRPHFMYMGEKDFQQVFILEQMLKDLNIPTQIVRCPTCRETDGLAMSSRNIYLSEEERTNAASLYNSFILAKELYRKGIKDLINVSTQISELIFKNKGIIEYIAFVNNDTFEDERAITKDSRMLLAVRIGSTRLIDNMLIGTE